jgi:FkbM family methyltransferase
MGLAIKKPVVVMALYDIGRDSWNSFNMSYDTYLWWMRNTLSIDVPVVVYAEKKFIDKIKKHRKEFYLNLEKTVIVEKPLEELDCYKLYYEKLSKLMFSEAFKKKIQTQVPEMNQPLYNIIMFNKVFFMQDAKKFFDGDMYIWADAGGLREDVSNYKNEKWPCLEKINELDNSKVTFFSHSKTISVRDNEYHALSQIRYIQGTAFLVPVNLIDELTNEFLTTVDECVESGFIGSDEKIFDITYCKNRDKYNLIKCDWRTYFNLLKDDGLKLFDKNGNQSNNVFIDFGSHECQGIKKFIDKLDMDKSWQIYAFEPNPSIDTENYAKEIEEHKIKTFKKAVWKRNGRTIFNQHGKDGKSQGSLLEETGGGKGYGDFYKENIVDCIDALEFINKIDKAKNIYIKMDIEWSEYEVLRHMLQNWPSNIKKMWIQFHGRNEEEKSTIKKLIQEKGTEIEDYFG